tara:strand:+ start:15077 stop:15226 length:150 start_codon:yes stop_codon:yes gene_type:complete
MKKTIDIITIQDAYDGYGYGYGYGYDKILSVANHIFQDTNHSFDVDSDF